jgi:hypothetical protein
MTGEAHNAEGKSSKAKMEKNKKVAHAQAGK